MFVASIDHAGRNAEAAEGPPAKNAAAEAASTRHSSSIVKLSNQLVGPCIPGKLQRGWSWANQNRSCCHLQMQALKQHQKQVCLHQMLVQTPQMQAAHSAPKNQVKSPALECPSQCKDMWVPVLTVCAPNSPPPVLAPNGEAGCATHHKRVFNNTQLRHALAAEPVTMHQKRAYLPER